MMTTTTLRFSIILVSFLFAMSPCFSASETIQTGVASPGTVAEKNNIEKLRERAIRNAMDLAVMQVTGVSVSSERGDSLRSKEKIITKNEKVEEQSSQQSRYRAGATTRSDGYARLVKIIKEWQDNGQYYVKARISVDTKEEIENKKNAGDYWRQVGKPPISMSFIEESNDEKQQDQQNHTLRFLRDNLASNGVKISTGENMDSQYQIKVLQILQSKELAGFGTITMHCRLSFQIIGQKRGESVAEYRASHGPQAGFTEEQAKESCIKAIAPQVSENLIRSIGKLMLDRWNNGVEQKIVIVNMPGESVTKVSEILQNLYRITYTKPARYTNGRYIRTLKFKGTATDLAQSIKSAFGDEDWDITVTRIADGEIYLQWKTIQ